MNLRNKIFSSSLLLVTTQSAFALDLGTFNDTNFSFGGYIKAQGVFNDPDNGDSNFSGTARQSRFNFGTSKTVDGHNLKGFIEGDFYGGNSTNSTYDWRLRHAYVKVDNLTLGQSWSGQFLGTEMADVIDFLYGLRGTLGGKEVRQAGVHYQFGGGRISFQDPVYSDSDMPDMTLGYKYRSDSGSSLGAVLSVRNIQNNDTVAGANIGGKLMLGHDDMRFNILYGDGLAAFTGVGSDVNDAGDSVDQFGYNLAYRHFWSPNLRSSVQYTKVEVNDKIDTEYDSYHANLIYSYLKNLEFGLEWRQFDWSNDVSRNTQQFEIMAKYKF